MHEAQGTSDQAGVAKGAVNSAGASILVNKDGSGWRDWLGKKLRAWAQRLDGRLSLSVEFRTTHPVDPIRLQYCMDKGLECAVMHATEFARESAVRAARSECGIESAT